jgi:hypothetical protein
MTVKIIKYRMMKEFYENKDNKIEDYQLENYEDEDMIGKTGNAIGERVRPISWVYEASRLPHLLDNGLTDGSEVVNFTRRSPFNPRKIPDTHFC